jgi:hypothetical protein
VSVYLLCSWADVRLDCDAAYIASSFEANRTKYASRARNNQQYGVVEITLCSGGDTINESFC